LATLHSSEDLLNLNAVTVTHIISIDTLEFFTFFTHINWLNLVTQSNQLVSRSIRQSNKQSLTDNK